MRNFTKVPANAPPNDVIPQRVVVVGREGGIIRGGFPNAFI